MRKIHVSMGVLLALATLGSLAGCSAPAGVECEPLASFEGDTYLNYRVIDSRGSSSSAEREFGESIGSASPKPCEGIDTDDRYSAYEIPEVDPAVGVILVDGALGIYVRRDLADNPETWPAPLEAFVNAHPAATDM